ncbi:MAG: hypothetical protein HY876_08815 [Coriobacteriales bacterium]|nr:hypothetical protein [Coriobacteriales bacterium]
MVWRRMLLVPLLVAVGVAATIAAGASPVLASDPVVGSVNFGNDPQPLFTLPWRSAPVFELAGLAPSSVDRMPDGDLLVASRALAAVFRVRDGAQVWRYDAADRGLATFDPVSAHPTQDGHVLIVDRGTRTVLEVDDEGSTVWSWDAGDQVPTDACRADDGSTFVAVAGADPGVLRMKDGRVAWRSPASLLSSPASVLAEDDGSILVADRGSAETSAQVASIVPSGSDEAAISWRLSSGDVAGMRSFDAATRLGDGRVAMCDASSSRIVITAPDATGTATAIQSTSVAVAPAWISQSSDGGLVIADAASDRVVHAARVDAADVAGSFEPTSSSVITSITCEVSQADRRVWVAADDGEWIDLADEGSELPLGKILRWRVELTAQDPLSTPELRNVTLMYEASSGDPDDDGWLPEDVPDEGFTEPIDDDSSSPAASDSDDESDSDTSATQSSEAATETVAALESTVTSAPVAPPSAGGRTTKSRADGPPSKGGGRGAGVLGALWALGLAVRPTRNYLARWTARGARAASPSVLHHILHRFFA